MSICFKENLNISGEVLEELIVTSNHDLRQILHRLSLLTFVNKTLSLEEAKKNGEDIKKPINMVLQTYFWRSEKTELWNIAP